MFAFVTSIQLHIFSAIVAIDQFYSCYQIDGFEQDKRVVLIAATNRKQDLDPALIRYIVIFSCIMGYIIII